MNADTWFFLTLAAVGLGLFALLRAAENAAKKLEQMEEDSLEDDDMKTTEQLKP